jgi:hypothetical protein
MADFGEILQRAAIGAIRGLPGVNEALMDRERIAEMKARRELLQAELQKQVQAAEDRKALGEAYAAAHAEAQAPASTAAQMAASGVEPAKREPPENDITNPSLYRAEAIPVTSVPAPESPLPPVAIAQQGVRQPTPQQTSAQPDLQQSPQRQVGYNPAYFDSVREKLIKSGKGHLIGYVNQDEAALLKNEVGRLDAIYRSQIMPLQAEAEKARLKGEPAVISAEQKNKLTAARLLDAEFSARKAVAAYRLAMLGMQKDAINVATSSEDFEEEPAAIRFVRGVLTKDGFKKNDNGSEYMVFIGRDGNPVKIKGGGIAAIPRDTMENLYNQYYGSKPEVIKVGPGEKAFAMDPRTQTIKPIAEGGQKESELLSNLKEARNHVETALGVTRDQLGNIISGGDHAKNLPQIMANVEVYIRAGMPPAAAAKKAYDEYIRQHETEKATGGGGKPAVPGVTQQKEIPTPWRK